MILSTGIIFILSKIDFVVGFFFFDDYSYWYNVCVFIKNMFCLSKIDLFFVLG